MFAPGGLGTLPETGALRFPATSVTNIETSTSVSASNRKQMLFEMVPEEPVPVYVLEVRTKPSAISLGWKW